jgi:hypothetical protein
MSTRTAQRVAWGAAGISALLVLAGLVLRLPALDEAGYLLPIAIPFVAVGALLASKRPGNPIGWLFLAFGCMASVDFAAASYAYRALSEGSSLPAGDLAASIYAHFWHPGFGLFVFAFLLFPNGRLLSPRWRWFAGMVVFTYGGLLLSGSRCFTAPSQTWGRTFLVRSLPSTFSCSRSRRRRSYCGSNALWARNVSRSSGSSTPSRS